MEGETSDRELLWWYVSTAADAAGCCCWLLLLHARSFLAFFLTATKISEQRPSFVEKKSNCHASHLSSLYHTQNVVNVSAHNANRHAFDLGSTAKHRDRSLRVSIFHPPPPPTFPPRTYRRQDEARCCVVSVLSQLPSSNKYITTHRERRRHTRKTRKETRRGWWKSKKYDKNEKKKRNNKKILLYTDYIQSKHGQKRPSDIDRIAITSPSHHALQTRPHGAKVRKFFQGSFRRLHQNG